MEATPEAAALSERIRVNGVPAEATLSAGGALSWIGGDGVEQCVAVESDVLGFEAVGSAIRVKAFVGEHKGVPSGGGLVRNRRDFVMEMPTEESLLLWNERLRECISSLGRPRRLFVFVNPYGGKRCAQKIFHNEIKPLLQAADILYTLQETEYHLHAQEVTCSLDLVKYDGIVCVSGDGVLVEVVNGLLQREDWESAIKVPLGIIPAGTGNGMAKSLLDSVGDVFSVSNATFAIIRGHRRSLDVSTILQGDTKFFSVLMLTWGLVADIDIESEKYRWMGSARFDFYSFLRILYLRKYCGHVHFVPAPGYEVYGESIKQNASYTAYMGENRIPRQSQGDDAKVQQCGYQGPVTPLESSEWRSLDGPFISVWLSNVRWTGEDVMPAPEAKFSDGYLDAIIIRDCPKPALLSLLFQMKDGSHVKSPYVLYLKVKAFRLEPGQRVGSPSIGGIIDSDGEVIARGGGTYRCDQQGDLMAYGPPIHLRVDEGLATIFSPR